MGSVRCRADGFATRQVKDIFASYWTFAATPTTKAQLETPFSPGGVLEDHCDWEVGYESATKWRNVKGREGRPFGTIRRLMLVVSIVLVAAS
jgi:hypothetical protein